MGMYDGVEYPCFWCKTKNNAQTKILGRNILHNYEIGEKFLVGENEVFYNCILNLKNKCKKCDKETAIIIKDGKFVGVENPKYSTIIEGHWGNFEVVDELKVIINEKLRKDMKK